MILHFTFHKSKISIKIPIFPYFPVVFATTSAPLCVPLPSPPRAASGIHLEVGETARAVMPEEITEPRFLQDWKQEILEVAEPRWIGKDPMVVGWMDGVWGMGGGRFW